MAYCRHGDDSDVYLFCSSKYEARASRLFSSTRMDDAFIVDTPQEALAGLLRFRKDGFKVPDYAIERLEREIQELSSNAEILEFPEGFDPLDPIAEPLRSMYMNYLEVTDVSQICQDYSVFGDEAPEDDDEMWKVPKGFKSELEMDDVSTSDFSVGYLTFGTYGGKKVIIEANASPLLVYWKK